MAKLLISRYAIFQGVLQFAKHMMTSSNGNIFRVTGGFPSPSPVTWSFDVFLDLRLNNRLSKQSWGWWFETPSRPLWRHCNVGDNMAKIWISRYAIFQAVLYFAEHMITSWNGNIFRVTGPLWGESIGHRWIPQTQSSDAELWCFLWSAPEQTA